MTEVGPLVGEDGVAEVGVVERLEDAGRDEDVAAAVGQPGERVRGRHRIVDDDETGRAMARRQPAFEAEHHTGLADHRGDTAVAAPSRPPGWRRPRIEWDQWPEATAPAAGRSSHRRQLGTSSQASGLRDARDAVATNIAVIVGVHRELGDSRRPTG